MLQKVGCHAIRATPSALRWAGRAHVVKSLDNVAILQAARPEAIRIFRHFFRTQDVNASPALVASEILNALGGYRHPNLVVEVFNELPRQMTARYADLLAEVVPILHASGVKVAGPCWSTGDYEAEDWQEMRARGWAGLDYIALHAYWGNAHGLPDHEVFTPWNALRYRSCWQPGDPPILITECGRDTVRDGPNGTYVGKKGWRNDGLADEDYLVELERYERYLQEDACVLGATVFSSGPTDDWRAFDVDDISDRFDVSRTPPVVQASSQSPSHVNEEPRMATLGRGLWVWYVDKCGGPEGIVATAKRTGCSWVTIKGGDGPSKWSQLTPDLIARIKALMPELKVWGWTYNYGGAVPGTPHDGTWTVDDEIAVAKAVVASGVDGYVADVEAEWAQLIQAPAQTGERFAQALRLACDEAEIPFAYAPLPVIANFTRLPYVQFNAVCDYVMPQLYAGNMQFITDPVWDLPRMIAHWRQWRTTWEGWGLRVPPMAPVGDAYDLARPADVGAFEDAAQAEAWTGWSYWEMSQAGDARLDAMNRTTAPQEDDDMIALTPEDRAEIQSAAAAAFAAGETFQRVLSKYGRLGTSIGAWQGEVAKGAAVTVKDVCGLNA
jgi:hypothetical protein